MTTTLHQRLIRLLVRRDTDKGFMNQESEFQSKTKFTNVFKKQLDVQKLNKRQKVQLKDRK